MLETFAYPLLRTRQPVVIIQLDGAPAYWELNVRAFLNARFGERWIGRDGPTPWPPRSPDINPLDFFLWGYVKTRVFRTPVTSLRHLKRRINQAFSEVTDISVIIPGESWQNGYRCSKTTEAAMLKFIDSTNQIKCCIEIKFMKFENDMSYLFLFSIHHLKK